MKRVFVLSLLAVFLVSGLVSAAGWSEPVIWEKTTADTDRMPWYDQDSQTLYFTRNYNLHQSQLVDGEWTEPTEIVIPGLNHRQNQVSPLRRGDNLYFASFESATDYDFFVSTWDADEQEWGTVNKIAALSGETQDWALWVSSDETLAYLISKGPFADQQVRGGRGIWKSEKVNDTWSTPVPLLGEINSETNDWSIFVDEATNQFYVSSTREGALEGSSYNLWVFDGEEGVAQNLGLPVNGGNIRDVWTNGKIMFFTGQNYPGGISTYDIFVSIWED